MRTLIALLVLSASSLRADVVPPCQGCGNPAPLAMTHAATEVGDALRFVLVNGGYAEVPLTRLDTGHLAVEVALNGQRGLFLIDSGASRSVVDAARAGLYPLGPVTEIRQITGIVGDVSVEGRAVAAYRIGEVVGTDTEIFVADLSFVAQAIAALGGPVVDGIVGQDWLTRHGAILDMGDDRVFLRP